MCENHKHAEDTNPFIISYSLKPVRLFVTSTNSLLNLAKADNIQLDATYKLTLYGFPVIVVGFSDIQRSFYCSGLILAENEDLETYK